MNGWTLTKVWQVDHKLVVADTINEAVELFKAYMGKDYHDEPDEVRCIGTDTAPCDHNALIAEQGETFESKTIKSKLRGKVSVPIFLDEKDYPEGEEVIVNIRKK